VQQNSGITAQLREAQCWVDEMQKMNVNPSSAKRA
jgi:hypothetical protein